MKYLFLLFLLPQFVFSSVKPTEEVSVFSQETEQKKEILSQTTNLKQNKDLGIDYNKETRLENTNQSKSLYLSYTNYPEFIYEKQTFEINVNVIVARTNYDKIDVRFINASNVAVLNPSAKWNNKQKQEYENTYYLKVLSPTFVMPTLQILLYNNGKVEEVEYLKAPLVQFAKLASGNKKFSQVIAKELKVTNYKTKQYNNKQLLTIIEMYSVNGNLEDFNLGKEYEDQGSTSFEESYPLQNLVYHVVVPIHTKKISFNYYNLKKSKFESINLPIVLENDLISTQSDLNPNNSNLEFYKKIAIASLLFLFLVVSLWKRKLIYFIITLVLVIILILYMMPNKTTVIKKDVIIYILPTKNSTVFFKTQKEQLVEILNKKAGFYKVLFNTNNKQSEIIGWIKENDVSKN